MVSTDPLLFAGKTLTWDAGVLSKNVSIRQKSTPLGLVPSRQSAQPLPGEAQCVPETTSSAQRPLTAGNKA